MKRNKIFFVIGIYIAACIAISGNYFLNPKVTYDYTKITKYDFFENPIETVKFYDADIKKGELLNKHVTDFSENKSFKKFKYSILYSIVGLFILISLLQLKIKK